MLHSEVEAGPDYLARQGLGKLIGEIYDRKPVSDPHVMLMGVGDARTDRAPLQVTQFEADNRVAKQLTDIYLEGNGGGNGSESYTLPWYFAAHKTDIDCVKQGRKGILFTFGDEQCPPDIRADQIRRVLDEDVKGSLKTKELLELVSQKYDVFHLVVEEGDYAKRYKDDVYKSWEDVLPKDRVIPLTNYKKLPEVIVSILEVHNGKTHDEVLANCKSDALPAVRKAIERMPEKKHQPKIHNKLTLKHAGP